MLLADRLKSDPDFLKKLPRYKTAWSPTYNCFVGIVKVWEDDYAMPIIQARLAYTDQLVLFRVEELTDFVL
jgi:hypothetical protein